ncbi:MAG: hypothetical protein CME65_00505 [Halobacteriovoraceae bacterium]|nr:hypothetical protein [Halobacteriovoraceae bacterium]|tara:strand:- start:6206 stop:6598 length:393 start_codon:yes stop_codon:yes gene_type:complete
MIDINVEQLNIEMTDLAVKQLKNIIENDYTLEGLVFRLKIKGKECHGFTYSLGFTSEAADDLIYQVKGITIHIDPFTAYYCQEGIIEYLFDLETDQEGFFFENKNEKQYRGKFFKNEAMTPPIKDIGVSQ